MTVNSLFVFQSPILSVDLVDCLGMILNSL